MAKKEFDLIVIGAGPAGYVAAIRAAQLGMSVACIDRHVELGGTCLRVGCIPSKALLESSHLYAAAQNEWSEHGIKAKSIKLDLDRLLKRKNKVVKTLTQGVGTLLKRNKVEVFNGDAKLAGNGKVVVQQQKGGDQQLAAKHILIATGSKPAALPNVDWDPPYIGSSTDALAYESVPEHLVVIGAGYIGLELGSVWLRLGAKVTVLEALDRILPGADTEMAAAAHKIFDAQGFQFQLGARVERIEREDETCRIHIADGEPVECDRVLIAIGRKPCTDGLDLDAAGVKLDQRGQIEVDDDFRTTAEGVYAIGDCIRGPMLAHKASDEGVACVERIAGHAGIISYDAIPAVVYTSPELAWVGKTEEELDEAGIEYRKGSFPFQANGRARTLGDTDGKVKILADAKSDRLLGVHILGSRAGDMIAEAAAAMAFHASAEDLVLCPHAHPTLSEALREAAIGVAGQPLHLPPK